MVLSNAAGDNAGSIGIVFGSTMNFYLSYCSDNTDFSTTLPSSTTKIWRITLRRPSDDPRVLIHCNDEEVANVQLSDSVCTHSSYKNTWRKYWTRKAKKMKFSSGDKASDYFRAYKGK